MIAFKRKAGRSLVVLGMGLFILCGLFPIGSNLLAALESQYQYPKSLPEHVDGIVVLGGAFDTAITQNRGVPALNDAAERMTTAAAFIQKYPQAIILFSGGNGRLLDREGTEAQSAALFLKKMNLPTHHVFYEDESRNTYENIRFSSRLMLPQPGETWLLVTSAYHMPRAMGVAKTAKWDFVPVPVDYRTTGEMQWLPKEFNMLGNFAALQTALHEYLGLLAYHMTRKISLSVT